MRIADLQDGSLWPDGARGCPAPPRASPSYPRGEGRRRGRPGRRAARPRGVR